MPEKPKHLIGRAIVRVYAVAVLLLTCWAGYAAVTYLFGAVFTPAKVPERFVAWTKAVDASQIHRPPPADAPSRAPLSRYHQVRGALPRDATNGCLTSGCHAPLPHVKSAEVRAFANMHVTFMDCEVCHVAPNATPDRLAWVNLESGEPQETPAHLRLLKLLQVDPRTGQTDPKAMQEDLLPLIDAVLRVSTRTPRLGSIRLTLETAPPGSPVWMDTIEAMRAESVYHARGDYGAKIARDVPAETRRGARKLLNDKAEAWLDLSPGDKRRDEIYDEIHARLIAKPGACLACHGGEPPRVDYVALGYAPERAAELRGSAIARQMQHIRDGQPFHLPGVLEERDAP